MYLDFFGLSAPPFKITPNTELFYGGCRRGAILDALVYAIVSGEGIVKVVGEVGSGKTMLCRMLEVRLPPTVEIVYLPNPSLNKEELLNIIAAELKVDTGAGGASATSLIRSLQDCLIERHAGNRQVVVFVEEAQAMPLETLEEIRLLSNLETNHHKLLQIILFGQPELDHSLALPRMRQLKERITHGFKLQPFAPEDVGEYLEHRLRAAGYHGPNLFSPPAVKLIAQASEGITRRINILADKTLLAAFSENTHDITPRHAKTAIADSEFGSRRQDARRNGTPALRLAIGFCALLAGMAIGAGLLYRHQQGEVSGGNGGMPTPPARPLGTPPKTETGHPAEAPRTQPAQDEHRPPAVSQSPDQDTPKARPQDLMEALPASLPTPLSTGIQAARQWLQDTALPGFSIQVNFISGPNSANQSLNYLKTIREYASSDDVMIYHRLTHDNQDSFGFLLGRYDTQELANRAMQDLNPGLKSFKPQIRTRSGILGEIKKY